MRIILHIDMNSYFATVEQQSNPFLRGKPICVAGKGSGERTVCAALSIEAKKMGCKGAMSVWEAREVCPSIVVVQADYTKYQFVSRAVFAIFESYTPLVEIFSIDEAFLDLTNICNDYIEAQAISISIKERLKHEVGDYLTCSIGISHNKLLAKLASEMQKPDGLTILDKAVLPKILAETPIEDVCGIGRQITKKLHLLSIRTMAELGSCNLERLIVFFGKNQGKTLHFMGQGISDDTVLPYYQYPAEKSFGHSYTLPKNIFKPDEAKPVLLKLAEKVARRMRKAKAMGKTIHLYVRFSDFAGFAEQTTIANFINDGLKIYEIGLRIIEQYNPNKPIRAISITVTNLKREMDVPQALLAEDIDQEKIVKASDIINDRYGEFTLFRASLVPVKNKIENIPDGRNKRIMKT
jgi:DNA polymerase-4